jgi:preprotein translocase subunit SecA
VGEGLPANAAAANDADDETMSDALTDEAMEDHTVDEEMGALTDAVDEQARRPPQRSAPRLTYIFLAEELLNDAPADEIAAQALQHLLQAQAVMKTDLGAVELNEAYRRLLLWSIDERWVDYLTRLEELRYEVRLEGMAHNDPLVMYKSMASGAYGTLLTELRRLAVAQMFTFLPATRPDGAAEASALEKATPKLTYLKLG